MSEITIKNRSRRGFLGTAAAVVGVGPAMSLLESFGLSPSAPATSSATVLAGSSVGSTSGYRCLNRDEAAFTEAMVNALCPADHLTPDGVTCGLAAFVDCALAQGSIAVATRFKAGIAVANGACRRQFGVRFDQLAAIDAGRFLQDVFASRVDGGVTLASWAHEVVNPVLMHACFAGPVYDGYCNRVFWKIFGHPGEPTSTYSA
jgi:gluconate 2-dehydrogenase gamma chain